MRWPLANSGSIIRRRCVRPLPTRGMSLGPCEQGALAAFVAVQVPGPRPARAGTGHHRRRPRGGRSPHPGDRGDGTRSGVLMMDIRSTLTGRVAPARDSYRGRGSSERGGDRARQAVTGRTRHDPDRRPDQDRLLGQPVQRRDAAPGRGRPSVSCATPRFLRQPALVVACRALSLNAIEHGLLRRSRWRFGAGVRREPVPLSAFERQHRVARVDPRVHFALNCAAGSCRSIAADVSVYAPTHPGLHGDSRGTWHRPSGSGPRNSTSRGSSSGSRATLAGGTGSAGS